MDKVIAVIRCPPQYGQNLPTGSMTVLMVRESAAVRSPLSTVTEAATTAQSDSSQESLSSSLGELNSTHRSSGFYFL